MATITTDRLGSSPASPAYGNDVAAIEALGGTGVPERIGDNLWNLRPTTDFQNSVMQWGGTDAGVANAYVFVLSPVLTAYVADGVYGGKIGTGHTNTGACTANFGPGAKSIKMPDGTDPPSSALVAGQAYLFLYDGTNLVLLNGNAATWSGVSQTEVTVASASTCDILGAASLLVAISGTTTITSLGTGANRVRIGRFAGALTLTHNSTSLILPGGANITTAAGDCMIVESDASSNVRVLAYQKADGTAVVAASANAILGQAKGHIHGLTLSNNSSDATNDIDIAAGQAADSTLDHAGGG